MRVVRQGDLFALTGIQDPLRQHALHHLSGASLAHLRRANRAAQQLVDEHTGSTWKAAASELVEDTILPSTDSSQHSYAIQLKLRQQGALLHNLRLGELVALPQAIIQIAAYAIFLEVCSTALLQTTAFLQHIPVQRSGMQEHLNDPLRSSGVIYIHLGHCMRRDHGHQFAEDRWLVYDILQVNTC